MADFIPTRASMLKPNAAQEVIVTTYEGSKNKGTKSVIPNKEMGLKLNNTNKVETREDQEKQMKKLRFEVMKFGMTGLSKAKARQANLELAIKLGAKPPKNKRQNYKKLKERKQKEEEKKKEQIASGFDGSLLNMRRNGKKKSAPKRDKGILSSFGKVQKPGRK